MRRVSDQHDVPLHPGVERDFLDRGDVHVADRFEDRLRGLGELREQLGKPRGCPVGSRVGIDVAVAVRAALPDRHHQERRAAARASPTRS